MLGTVDEASLVHNRGNIPYSAVCKVELFDFINVCTVVVPAIASIRTEIALNNKHIFRSSDPQFKVVAIATYAYVGRINTGQEAHNVQIAFGSIVIINGVLAVPDTKYVRIVTVATLKQVITGATV